jgi:hypothetical protein
MCTRGPRANVLSQQRESPCGAVVFQICNAGIQLERRKHNAGLV